MKRLSKRLTLSKETISNLTPKEQLRINGGYSGAAARTCASDLCPTNNSCICGGGGTIGTEAPDDTGGTFSQGCTMNTNCPE